MTVVDQTDDSVRRFIPRRYAYDSSRHERRHIVVAAYDNEREFRQEMAHLCRELALRRDRGEPVDPREHVSGVTHEPGEARRRAAARIVASALRRGVTPPDSILAAAQGAAGFEFRRAARRVDGSAAP